MLMMITRIDAIVSWLLLSCGEFEHVRLLLLPETDMSSESSG